MATRWMSFDCGARRITSPEGPWSGVYALLCGGKIIYVGQSTNIGERINSHRKRLTFDRIKVKQVQGRVARLSIEHALIRRIKPIHNAFIPTGRRATRNDRRRWREANLKALFQPASYVVEFD